MCFVVHQITFHFVEFITCYFFLLNTIGETVDTATALYVNMHLKIRNAVQIDRIMTSLYDVF